MVLEGKEKRDNNYRTDEIMLFTDVSVNTRTNVGYGAYLVTPVNDYKEKSLVVKVKRFEHTSSTKLELQTLLWALNDIQASNVKITVYTDSQNIVGLQARRKRLESNNYLTLKNKLLKNHELYKTFYEITDQLNCKFVKVQGHKASSQKNDIDKLFTMVDKASRKALREGTR